MVLFQSSFASHAENGFRLFLSVLLFRLVSFKSIYFCIIYVKQKKNNTPDITSLAIFWIAHQCCHWVWRLFLNTFSDFNLYMYYSFSFCLVFSWSGLFFVCLTTCFFYCSGGSKRLAQSRIMMNNFFTSFTHTWLSSHWLKITLISPLN